MRLSRVEFQTQLFFVFAKLQMLNECSEKPKQKLDVTFHVFTPRSSPKKTMFEERSETFVDDCSAASN